MWRKVLYRDELDSLQSNLVEALALLEVNFPASVMYIKTHNMVHMVEKIQSVGPLYITSMFAYERQYKTLRHWIKNPRFPVASLVQNVVAFMMATLIRVGKVGSFSPSHVSLEPNGEGDWAADDVLLSPYTLQANGDWSIEAGIGRKQSVGLKAVAHGSSEYLSMHHLCYASNSSYRDEFDAFMVNHHLGGVAADEWPQSVDGEYQYHLWSEMHMRVALEAWRCWGVGNACLSEEQQLMCAGPPTLYFPHSEIRIAGHFFKATTQSLSESTLASLKDSIVLHGVENETDTLYFGRLREVRMFLQVGVDVALADTSSYTLPVLVVDWLDLAPSGQRMHTQLNVPVLKAQHGRLLEMSQATVKRTFTSAEFVHAQYITPTSNMLVPGVRGQQQVLVLNRDPTVGQLACFKRKFLTR
jgi:hypothetical protein